MVSVRGSSCAAGMVCRVKLVLVLCLALTGCGVPPQGVPSPPAASIPASTNDRSQIPSGCSSATLAMAIAKFHDSRGWSYDELTSVAAANGSARTILQQTVDFIAPDRLRVSVPNVGAVMVLIGDSSWSGANLSRHESVVGTSVLAGFVPFRNLPPDQTFMPISDGASGSCVLQSLASSQGTATVELDPSGSVQITIRTSTPPTTTWTRMISDRQPAPIEAP